eukprot:gene2736-1721_t
MVAIRGCVFVIRWVRFVSLLLFLLLHYLDWILIVGVIVVIRIAAMVMLYAGLLAFIRLCMWYYLCCGFWVVSLTANFVLNG